MVSFPELWEIHVELLTNALESTPEGYIGVGLIFFYLVWMVSIAGYRIFQESKEGHH